MKTIVEPFRIKMTEPLPSISKADRYLRIAQAHYNVFKLKADDCPIDLLTDSGTGAMSTKQWSALLEGDESYAGSRSYEKFITVVNKITGMPYIFPTHQGRAAEHLLAHVRVKTGDIVPNNSHFDTTRANIEYQGAEALNIMSRPNLDPSHVTPFKGNYDLIGLEECLQNNHDKIPFVMITITNNATGGQPVSLANIAQTKKLCEQYDKPLIIDACRFAENAFFIQMQEPGYEKTSLEDISQEIFSHADAITMSCKKDGIANIGGFFACRDQTLADEFQLQLILKEGFPTYGGLAGRDLEAVAVGLQEALQPEYQLYRHATVDYLANAMREIGIPIVEPPGGHAVFIDAKAMLPHIPVEQYPGISLVVGLYLMGGIRTVELGSVAFGKRGPKGELIPADLELVRLAFPRRVYTQSHFDYLIEALSELNKLKDSLPGFEIIEEPPFLRHFVCQLRPLGEVPEF